MREYSNIIGTYEKTNQGCSRFGIPYEQTREILAVNESFPSAGGIFCGTRNTTGYTSSFINEK